MMNVHVSITCCFIAFHCASSLTFISSSFMSITNSRQNFVARISFSPLFSEPVDNEGALDLNLEEMFEMFDAADNDKDFSDTVKKVKGESKGET